MIDPETWGVLPGYRDVTGRWTVARPATMQAILESMGAVDGAPPPDGPVVTIRLDRDLPAMPPGRVQLEDGGEIAVGSDGRLPRDLPAGYHVCHGLDGKPWRLIASPGRCPLPSSRVWGFASQLYATRSRESWGMGDFRDLRRLVSWSSGLGAGMVVVNPLHATAPVARQEASPYFAGSRCFLNPLYIAVEDVPGASLLADLDRVASAGRKLNGDRLIDRDAVWKLKSGVLEALFAGGGGGQSEGFTRFQAERGPALDGFAAYCALAEEHGRHWRDWPAELRHPGSPAVRRFVAGAYGARRVEFHSWLQWLADTQLAAASAEFGEGAPGVVGVVEDLAVGVDPSGADAWLFQESFASGMEVGAPPDEFNTVGQNWGLPPFDPWRLRNAGYQAWIEALRGAFRHAGGLRVDHVMGLFRLYWIPTGSEPAAGAYVTYPHHDLLNIVALEAQRAGAVVVGEDLGTVEDSMRADLFERDVLSYRVWWFEQDRPWTWPEKALAAVTTHDLPTVAGVLDGSDLETQRRLGLNPNEESSTGLRRRLLEWTGSPDGTEVSTVVERAYEDLSRAPCLLVAAGLEDALGVVERPNMPATTDEWPNWRISLPVPLEEIADHPLPRAVAARLQGGEA